MPQYPPRSPLSSTRIVLAGLAFLLGLFLLLFASSARGEAPAAVPSAATPGYVSDPIFPASAAEIREALATVRTAKDTHSKAAAMAALLAILISLGVQAAKRLRPPSEKVRRALPWIVASMGAVGGILASYAGGLPWVDALLVGMAGPGAIALRDMVAGVIGWDAPVPEDGPRVVINDGRVTPLQLPRQQRPMVPPPRNGLPPAAGLLLALSLASVAMAGCGTLGGPIDPLASWRQKINDKASIYTDCSVPVLVKALGETGAYAAEEVISKGSTWLIAKLLSAGAVEPIQWVAIGKDLVVWLIEHWKGEWKPEIATCIAARANQTANDLRGAGGTRVQAGEASPLVGTSWLLDNVKVWAIPLPTE